MFDSAVRSIGDLAGVFEFDGETSYFYLYRVDAEEGNKVVEAIKVGVGELSYNQAEVKIHWSADESMVFLRIVGRVVAVFDCVGEKKYGDDLLPCEDLDLPPSVLARLPENLR